MTADLLSGKELIKFIQNYLNQAQTQGLPLKITSKTNQNGSIHVYILRCTRFESLIKILENNAIVGLPSTQHNILQVFLNDALLRGHAVLFEHKIDEGFIIDLVVDGAINYELKVKRNVNIRQVGGFISQYLEDMNTQRAIKDRWWLTFFCQRADTKAKKGSVCIYYLVVIEMTSRNDSTDRKNRKKLIKNVQTVVDTTVQTVIEEDEIEVEPDDAALLPVKNVLLMERLRAEKKKLLSEIQKITMDTQNTLAEKDKALAEKDKALAEKDKALAEKDKALAEKDRIISEYKKKLNSS